MNYVIVADCDTLLDDDKGKHCGDRSISTQCTKGDGKVKIVGSGGERLRCKCSGMRTDAIGSTDPLEARDTSIFPHLLMLQKGGVSRKPADMVLTFRRAPERAQGSQSFITIFMEFSFCFIHSVRRRAIPSFDSSLL